MDTTDLITRQRGEVRERLRTLQSETAHLTLVDVALAGADAGAIKQARATLELDRGPTARTRPRRRRPAKPGERKAQILASVRAHPDGITPPDIAKDIGCQQTYVYRPLNALAGEGEIKKDSGKWLPVAA